MEDWKPEDQSMNVKYDKPTQGNCETANPTELG